MIARLHEVQTIRRLLGRNPVIGIVGARQVGKTTLARHVMAGMNAPAVYFDLENPEDMARLYDPMLALKQAKGLVVIDEVQRLPGLFQVLRVLADRARNPARFLILGSASPELLRQGSESLAGRVVFHELKGFSLDEVGIENRQRLWFRGGFPRAYLARTAAESYEWRRAFVQTFLERDLPQLGINIRSVALRRFWTMLAHYHAQTWNSSEFARAFGAADTTVRNYLDVVTAGLVVILMGLSRQKRSWKTLGRQLGALLAGGIPLLLSWGVISSQGAESDAVGNRLVTWHPPALSMLFEAAGQVAQGLPRGQWDPPRALESPAASRSRRSPEGRSFMGGLCHRTVDPSAAGQA